MSEPHSPGNISPPAKLVVLISGQGSNLQAIIDACHQGILNATLTGVISNYPNAYGLKRAQNCHIQTQTLTPHRGENRVDYDGRLVACVVALQPDWVILAGWMRILSNIFLRHFQKRVINLHPALPGTFPGIRAVERAFSAWQRGEIQHTGVMLHFVPDEGIDCGPVIAQTRVSILSSDDLHRFTERMRQAERQLLVQGLQMLINQHSGA